MYDTVLVPTDGSEHALRAAEHGRYLAGLFDATVHVLSVVDVRAAGGIFDAGGVSGEFVAELEAEAESAVEATVGGAEGIETAVRRGTPSEEILDYAEEHGADLVAMGTHGRTGVRRLVAGSVTERVLRLSPVPVVTVRATDRSTLAGDYDDVLVPTDGSDRAEAAVDHALAVAEAADATVHAVYVVEIGDLVVGSEGTQSVELYDRLESSGEEAAEWVASRAQAEGLDAVTEVRTGSAAGEILGYADGNGVDLIAMGTHGRTGLDRLLVGSTTERVVRRSEAPVLTVSPETPSGG